MTEPLSPGAKRLRIFVGMALAALVTAIAWTTAADRSTGPVDQAKALTVTVRYLLGPAACLLAGIGAVANRRFFVDREIDGGTGGDPSTEIALRYLQNTLEQAVLAAFAWTALAVLAPGSAATLVPMLSALFIVGRAAFWVGYRQAPWARAFGFGLTFYPTAVLLVWLIVRALVHGE